MTTATQMWTQPSMSKSRTVNASNNFYWSPTIAFQTHTNKG